MIVFLSSVLAPVVSISYEFDFRDKRWKSTKMSGAPGAKGEVRNWFFEEIRSASGKLSIFIHKISMY